MINMVSVHQPVSFSCSWYLSLIIFQDKLGESRWLLGILIVCTNVRILVVLVRMLVEFIILKDLNIFGKKLYAGKYFNNIDKIEA